LVLLGAAGSRLPDPQDLNASEPQSLNALPRKRRRSAFAKRSGTGARRTYKESSELARLLVRLPDDAVFEGYRTRFIGNRSQQNRFGEALGVTSCVRGVVYDNGSQLGVLAGLRRSKTV
jgi:hypothetical protein